MKLQKTVLARWMRAWVLVLICFCGGRPVLAQSKGFVQDYYVNAQLTWHKSAGFIRPLTRLEARRIRTSGELTSYLDFPSVAKSSLSDARR
jgi:hypothetical protein